MLRPFTLQNATVRLEPLAVGHAPELAAAAGAERAGFGYTWVPDGIDDARRYVAAALADAAGGRAVPFAVRAGTSGRLVGSTRFLDLDVFTWPPPWPPGAGRGPVPSSQQPPAVAEIGSTWYAPPAQGTGINAAAKLLMLRHAFEVWRVLRVTLKTDARNTRSRAAIERVGASFEGVRRAHAPAQDGTVRDTAYYSIIAAEWPAARAHLEQRLARVSA